MTKISKSKLKWVGNRNTTLSGAQLNYNVSDQIDYQKAILSLVRQMTDDVKKQIVKLFETDTSTNFFEQQKQAAAMDESITSKTKKLMAVLNDKFQKIFNDKSKKLATTMVNNAIKTSTSTLNTSLKQLSGGLTLKTSVIPKGMEDIANASIAENVALITSIPQKYLSDVTTAVMLSITTESGLKYLVPKIQKYNGQTHRRARNLALDQTRKAYNSINKQKLQAIGFKKFRWSHSGGGQHPRKSHIAMNGKIYSFDDLPVINKEQVDRGYESPTRGIPGQAINCRCTMTPVVQFDDGSEI